jgi:regulator of nucleoside diphosphate kinase
MRVQTSPIITEADAARLRAMVAALRNRRIAFGGLVDELARRIARAHVVPAAAIPPDFVTMRSRVLARDVDDGRAVEFALSYQDEIVAGDGHRLSVLTPLGMRAVGARAGDVIDWPLPRGQARRLRIERVLYQPESAGQFDL